MSVGQSAMSRRRRAVVAYAAMLLLAVFYLIGAGLLDFLAASAMLGWWAGG